MRALAAEVISIQRLICEGCGAETNATCNCGMPYKPKSARAKEAVEANPEKSNRAIAEEIGVDEKTVRKAREATADQSAVQERTGLDGKTRTMPEKRAEPEDDGAPDDDDDDEFEYDEETWPEQARKALRQERLEWAAQAKRARSAEKRCNELIVALNAKEVTEGRDWPFDKMAKKQVKKRDETLSNIAWWQKSLEKLYAEVSGQPAWRVEVTDKEGKRFSNGVRFALRNEAEGYAAKQQDGDGVTAEVIACDGEKPNVEVNGENIHFHHGDCVLFNWHPIADVAPPLAPPPADGLSIPDYLKRS